MSDHNSEEDYDNVDFDVWYQELKKLAGQYGENVSHVDSWREDFDQGISVEDSFYEEFDEHTRPAPITDNGIPAKTTLSRVLNTDADQIVLLPLDHPFIAMTNEQSGFIQLIRERLPENLRHLVISAAPKEADQAQTNSTLNIPTIDDVNYSAVVVALNLDGIGDEAGEDFFVERSRELSVADSDKTINDQGYRFVYQQLRANHMSLEYIFQNMPKYTNDLVETTPDHVLSELAVNYEELGTTDRLMLAVERLKDDPQKTYVTDYKVDASTLILYRIVA